MSSRPSSYTCSVTRKVGPNGQWKAVCEPTKTPLESREQRTTPESPESPLPRKPRPTPLPRKPRPTPLLRKQRTTPESPQATAAYLRYLEYIRLSTDAKTQTRKKIQFEKPKKKEAKKPKTKALEGWSSDLDRINARQMNMKTSVQRATRKKALENFASRIQTMGAQKTAQLQQWLVDFGVFIETTKFTSLDAANSAIVQRAEQFNDVKHNVEVENMLTVLQIIRLNPGLGRSLIGGRVNLELYHKMLKSGVPRQAVENKLKKEGLDPNILERKESSDDEPDDAPDDAPDDGSESANERPNFLSQLTKPITLKQRNHNPSTGGENGLRPSITFTDLQTGPLQASVKFFLDGNSLNAGIALGVRCLSEHVSVLTEIRQVVKGANDFENGFADFSKVLDKFNACWSDKDWCYHVGAVSDPTSAPFAMSLADAKATMVVTPHPFFEVFKVFLSDERYREQTAKIITGVEPAAWLKRLEIDDLKKLCPLVGNIKQTGSKQTLVDAMIANDFPSNATEWQWKALRPGRHDRRDLPIGTTLRLGADVTRARQLLLQVIDPSFITNLFSKDLPQRLAVPPNRLNDALFAVTQRTREYIPNQSVINLLIKLRNQLTETETKFVKLWVSSSNGVYDGYELESEDVPKPSTAKRSANVEGIRDFCKKWSERRGLFDTIDSVQFLVKNQKSQRALLEEGLLKRRERVGN